MVPLSGQYALHGLDAKMSWHSSFHFRSHDQLPGAILAGLLCVVARIIYCTPQGGVIFRTPTKPLRSSTSLRSTGERSVLSVKRREEFHGIVLARALSCTV